ncbi:MAG: alkaline phosphatase [Polyangiaceae bacterium]|nr:alkaline phosphatase [Polyangiaceae bacterium]
MYDAPGCATASGRFSLPVAAVVLLAMSSTACARITDPGKHSRGGSEFARARVSPDGGSGRRSPDINGGASSATTGGSAGAAAASANAGSGGMPQGGGGASRGFGSGGGPAAVGGTEMGSGGTLLGSGGTSRGGGSGGLGSGGELTVLAGDAGAAHLGSSGFEGSGGSVAGGGASAADGQAQTGGLHALAGAAGMAGSLCAGCLPAHCYNGVFDDSLGELLVDCGGPCANNCRCGNKIEPTLGTDCSTGLYGGCAEGTVTCESSGIRCAPRYGTPEECDGVDNDCNGEADYPYELIDDDGDGHLACADTDDTDPDVWSSHATCLDRDGDEYYAGCDAYSAHQGPDCNDDDPKPGSCAKNVILFIGDGMGFNHVLAGRSFDNGNGAPLTLETLPEHAEMTTFSASSSVTDSAAAATAMATGHKVDNGVIAMAIPGDRSELPTALELRKARGQATGLVTIHDSVSSATPAGFGAHSDSRGDTSEIMSDLSTGSRPNLLFGDDTGAVSSTEFADAGYTVIETEQALLGVDPASAEFLLGLFPSDVPTLALRTWRALQILDQDPDGFFLMVEQADTDKQSHANNLSGVVDAVIELDGAVQVALAWAAARTDTLIIVTADHETGGLVCGFSEAESTSQGVLPDCSFTCGVHTAANVPVFATGVGAGSVVGVLDNTEIFALIAGIGP